MNQGLNEQDRKALVDYRMERAHQTIKEAEYLLKGNFYNAAINYACYYATEALLLANGISARTHAGGRSMLGLHFIAKGLITIESGKTFGTLFEKRHSGDYDDFVYCDKELVESLIPKAKAFIDEVGKLLTKTN